MYQTVPFPMTLSDT